MWTIATTRGKELALPMAAQTTATAATIPAEATRAVVTPEVGILGAAILGAGIRVEVIPAVEVADAEIPVRTSKTTQKWSRYSAVRTRSRLS